MAPGKEETNKNCFNFLRLLFAFMVIITHSYAILGMEETDLLYVITDGQLKFSFLAVNSFFVISGYFITISFVRSSSVGHYVFKRLLRIVPAFWAVILTTALFLGVFVAEDSSRFFTSHETVNYIVNNICFRIHYHIDGIFSGKAINGSLWTIPYELFFYLFMIPILWPFKRKSGIWVVVVLFIIFWLLAIFRPVRFSGLSLPIFWLSLPDIFRLGALFLGGSIMSFIDLNSNRTRLLLISISVLGICLSLWFEFYSYTEYLLLPVSIIAIGLSENTYLSRVTSKGDFSYGVYLWAFPIQQTLNQYITFQSPLHLTLVTLPLALLFGVISWYLIERRFLRFKDIAWTSAARRFSAK